MEPFNLHPRLQQDCHRLGDSDSSLLLLLNNACYPWFIIVPKVTQNELYLLDTFVQQELLSQVNHLSGFLKDELCVDKINMGAIGNLVPQLHIHVIGRRQDDPAWPGVVWGHPESKDYSEDDITALVSSLAGYGQSPWILDR